MGAVCQWGRLSCKDPAGTTRCVVFTGRLRTFKKNTKMQGLSRLGVVGRRDVFLLTVCGLGTNRRYSVVRRAVDFGVLVSVGGKGSAHFFITAGADCAGGPSDLCAGRRKGLALASVHQ